MHLHPQPNCEALNSALSVETQNSVFPAIEGFSSPFYNPIISELLLIGGFQEVLAVN